MHGKAQREPALHSVVLDCKLVLLHNTRKSLPAAYWFSQSQYRTSDVAENLGRFLVRSVPQGNDFELILTVKIKTRLDIPQRDHLVVKSRRVQN